MNILTCFILLFFFSSSLFAWNVDFGSLNNSRPNTYRSYTMYVSMRMHVGYISHNFSPREQALIYIELMLHSFFFVPASLCLCVNVCRKVIRRKMIKLRVVNLSVDKRRKQSTANNQQTRTFNNFSHNFFEKKNSPTVATY